jgi:hypothetical protein
MLNEKSMKFTLGKKLGLGFGAILALMIFGFTAAYVKSDDIRQSQDITFQLRFPSLETARKLQRDLNYTQVKGRQAILAGTNPAAWEEARKAFDRGWNDIDKEVAQLDEYAPEWIQEDRDRLEDIKRRLPQLRAPEEAAMKHAASGEKDAVIKAGDENAALVTPANIAIKKSLDALADDFVALLDGNKADLHAENRSLNRTMAAMAFAALGIGTCVAVSSQSRHCERNRIGSGSSRSHRSRRLDW